MALHTLPMLRAHIYGGYVKVVNHGAARDGDISWLMLKKRRTVTLKSVFLARIGGIMAV